MLDTITGHLTEFDLKQVNRFEVQPGRINCYGEEISATKKFYNAPSFNIDIKPTGDIYYKTSLPHLIHKTSLYEITEKHYEDCVNLIKKELDRSGLIYNSEEITKVPLARIDFCRNIIVENPVPEYIFCLSQFRMPRRDKMNWKTETVSFRNSLRELCIYNKVLEINTVKNCIPERRFTIGMPENVLRLESRFRKGSAIKSQFGVLNLEDAFHSDLTRSILQADLNSLTRANSIQLELNLEDSHNLMEQIKRDYSSNRLKTFLSTMGVPIFLQKFNYDFDLIKEFLEEHFKRAAVYKALREIQEIRNLVMPVKQKDLLAEIKYKLAA